MNDKNSLMNDKNSLSDGLSIGEKGFVCQGGECHNIWRLGGKLSLGGVSEPLMDGG
jgi:hypothetical protein